MERAMNIGGKNLIRQRGS